MKGLMKFEGRPATLNVSAGMYPLSQIDANDKAEPFVKERRERDKISGDAFLFIMYSSLFD